MEEMGFLTAVARLLPTSCSIGRQPSAFAWSYENYYEKVAKLVKRKKKKKRNCIKVVQTTN